MGNLSLLFAIILLSGCQSFQEPDFNKPLINLPTNSEGFVENKEPKPIQQKVWVEAKTSRIWVSPRVDENGDYVEGHYKYIVLELGHWSVNGRQTVQQ